ncbi:MAG: hypothetical protein AAB972_00870, partial [Patescibacteria group bacterium]
RVSEAVIVLSAMLLSYMVVVNVQVITGFNIQPDHWYRVQFLPIAAAIFLLACRGWRKYITPYINMCAPIAFQLFLIFFFVSALYGQYGYSVKRAHEFAFSKEYAQGFEWLDAHTKQGSVVGTLSGKGNLDLELYTKNKIFLPFGLATIASNEELIQRLMILSKAWNIDPQTFAAIVRGEMANYLFGEQYTAHTFDASFSRHSWHIPDDFVEEKINEYTSFLHDGRTFASPYRLDYFFVDKNEFSQWKEPHEFIPSLVNVFDNSRVVIYSLR